MFGAIDGRFHQDSYPATAHQPSRCNPRPKECVTSPARRCVYRRSFTVSVRLLRSKLVCFLVGFGRNTIADVIKLEECWSFESRADITTLLRYLRIAKGRRTLDTPYAYSRIDTHDSREVRRSSASILERSVNCMSVNSVDIVDMSVLLSL